MAGSSTYTVILDANVLYPAPLSDLLLSLSTAKLFHARWTAAIENEWQRNLLANRPDLAGKVEARAAQMQRAVPDCLVENYEHLTAALSLPDENDRHVLAAAIVGHADAIVTFNLSDFPASALAPYNIEAIHPDDFVMNQLELNQLQALAAIKSMRARLRKPPISAPDLVRIFEGIQLPQTAAYLREAISLI